MPVCLFVRPDASVPEVFRVIFVCGEIYLDLFVLFVLSGCLSRSVPCFCLFVCRFALAGGTATLNVLRAALLLPGDVQKFSVCFVLSDGVQNS